MELQLFDYPLIEFFDLLGVENAIKLLTCLLLEHQILVFSSDSQVSCQFHTSNVPLVWLDKKDVILCLKLIGLLTSYLPL